MALALALHRHGQQAGIFDARARGAGLADQRILALSHGSRQTLEWLGAWEAIESTPIRTIHISQRGGLGRTLIRAEEIGVPALGYVLSAASLIAALDQAVARANIPYHEHSRIEDVRADNPQVSFRVGATLHQSALLAYAEGAIGTQAEANHRDYGQHALIFTATATTPHGGRAWERFTPDGPLALLPLAGNDGRDLAVVYTCDPEQATQLAALDEDTFLARLQAHFGSRLSFAAASPRHVFPLGLRYRKTIVGPRQVWLGNAAQTLHPVAGQGFNLALRDIRDLARSLGDADDPGKSGQLAAYAARRRMDRGSTIGFTDSLVRLFSNDHFLLQHLRGAGLLALDLLPPLRHFVARRMIWGARAW
ncbi:hypothetical protein CBW56_11315 [Denitratisoma oestradiolicum]|nr:hypothetical protein CBW56_11315 [Denitratisoma oestradiolicum]